MCLLEEIPCKMLTRTNKRAGIKLSPEFRIIYEANCVLQIPKAQRCSTWSLGFCMIVSEICPAPHDGLFSNDRQTTGCTLSPVRVQNPESQEAIKLNRKHYSRFTRFYCIGANMSSFISLHFKIPSLWLRPPKCMSGPNKVRVKRVKTITNERTDPEPFRCFDMARLIWLEKWAKINWTIKNYKNKYKIRKHH